MKFDTEGTYTLTYTATDSCGNSTSEERTVVVASPRTVLYTDGTFIINEQPEDRAANVAAHGEATNTYIPFDPNEDTNVRKYIFADNSKVLWKNELNSITNVAFGSAIEPTSTRVWFYNCTNLVTVDTVNLSMGLVTDASSMFARCRKLETLDVSNWDTSNVTNMALMFEECTSLRALDVSKWNTSKVTNMSKMIGVGDDTMSFGYLYELNVSNWDTSNVTNMNLLFKGCNRVQTLDVSNWDTSNVTDMSSLFERCQGLTELDLSNWDTSNVTDMSRMFSGTYYDTMFRLEKIYASNKFVVTQVTNSSSMFANMDSTLKGGAGTAWSRSNPIDATYARIDNPPDAPGYFTLKPSA